MVEDVPQLVDLTALDQRGLAEDGAHGFAQRLRAVEDHQQAAVGAQAAALQIRQQVLTDARVLGGPVPQAERVFLAIGRDPERHDQAVLADVHAVEEQGDQVEAVERRRLPRRQLRRRLRHEAAAHGALARAAARHVAGTGSRLRAYCRVATPTSICSTTRRFNGSTSAMRLERRQRHLVAAARTRGRRTATFRPPSTTSLGTVPAREAWRSA